MKYIIGLSVYYGLALLLAQVTLGFNEESGETLYTFSDDNVLFNYNWEYEYSDGSDHEESIDVREFNTLEEAQRKMIEGLFA